MIKVEKEKERLCHSCVGEPYVSLTYTKYGADIVLCRKCTVILANALLSLGIADNLSLTTSVVKGEET